MVGSSQENQDGAGERFKIENGGFYGKGKTLPGQEGLSRIRHVSADLKHYENAAEYPIL